VIAGITDSATVEVGAAPEEPAVIASPGVSPEPGSIEGDVAFTFGFKSVTGELQELELDIYLGENTGEGRNYAQHLGINLPAGSEAATGDRLKDSSSQVRQQPPLQLSSMQKEPIQ